MGYIYLILTILLEGSAVIFMKLSQGFEHKGYGIAAVIGYALSFVTLTLALKQLPVGIANATWAGASTLLVAVAGIFIFKEHLSAMQMVYMGLIIIGIVGLNLVRPA